MRNAIVHDMKIARFIEKDGQMLTPKPRVINEYRSWQKVKAVANDQDLIKKDFAEQYQQAKEDIDALEAKLNKIWELLTNDIRNEFYSENAVFREMFNIEFSAIRPSIPDIKSASQSNAPQYPLPSGTYSTEGTAIIIRSNNKLGN